MFDRCALQWIVDANEETGYTGMAVMSIDMYLHVLAACYEYTDGDGVIATESDRAGH